jgi:hypothetical protein
MQQEVNRLASTLKYLVAADSNALSTPAAAGDDDGILLSLIQRWRKERQAALRLELERLQQQTSIKKSAALPGKTETLPKANVSNDRNAEGAARWMSQAFENCVTQHGGLVSVYMALRGRTHSLGLCNQAVSNTATASIDNILLHASRSAASIFIQLLTLLPRTYFHARTLRLPPALRPLQVSSHLTFGSEGGISTGSTTQQTPDPALQQVVKPGLFTGAAVAAGEVLVAVPLQLAVPLRPWKLRVRGKTFWVLDQPCATLGLKPAVSSAIFSMMQQS